jgi:hypothetical protein
MKLFELQGSNSTIQKLERIFKSKLGKLYRYGGDTGIIPSTSGDTGYLYFYDHGAFQVNFSKSEGRVKFIDIWKDGAKAVAEQKPDFQIELPKDLSVFALITYVVDILKDPKVGDVKVDKSEVKESMVLREATRVSIDTFVSFAKIYAKKTSKSDLVFSYEELRQIALINDTQVPTAIRTLGIETRSNVFDLGRIEQDEFGTIIKVRGESEVQAFQYTPEPKLTKTEEETIEEVISSEELFDDLSRLVRMVCKGARPSLVVIGGPGTGKTKTIMDEVDAAGLSKGREWVMVKGKASPLALYSTIFMNKNKLIIFDDTDSIWQNEDSVNILKAALDSSPVRVVSWVSSVTQNVTHMTDEEKAEYEDGIRDELIVDPAAKVKLPSEFDFTGKVIFISNKPKKSLDSAVLNRSMFIDMTLTSKQVFDRIEGIMDKLAAPNDLALDDGIKQEVLEFLKEQSASGKLPYVSIRTFIGALGVASSGDPEWRRLLKYMGN